MGKTAIQWTDESWNPVTGCTRISPGCKNCYAFDLHDMRHEAYKNGKKVPAQYAKPFTEIQLMEDRLETPLKRRKPTMWFVNSMSDLFHKDVPDWFIDEVLGVAALTPQHTYQILTKRPERAEEMLNHAPRHNGGSILQAAFNRQRGRRGGIRDARSWPEPEWPLKNVWFGTSVEDQASADKRIPHIINVPGWVRFLSVEPLLGPVDLSACMPKSEPCTIHAFAPDMQAIYGTEPAEGTMCTTGFGHSVEWVIVGGESGRGSRECHLNWIRSIVDQCQKAGVAVFVKQLGAKPIENDRWDCYATEPRQVVDGLKIGIQDQIVMTMGGGEDCDYPLLLKDSHGGDWEEWPEELRVREFPELYLQKPGG